MTVRGYHWTIPGTRAELRDEEQACLTCPLPECDEDDPACPYRQEMHVERVGAAIQRDTMRRAVRLALTMEVT